MEDVKMKAFKNSVEQLFDNVDISAEYKAVFAEMLSYKWRALSNYRINETLAKAERKEAEDEQTGNADQLG